MSADWHSHALGFELLEVKKKRHILVVVETIEKYVYKI